jgi:hypothetical protein
MYGPCALHRCGGAVSLNGPERSETMVPEHALIQAEVGKVATLHRAEAKTPVQTVGATGLEPVASAV